MSKGVEGGRGEQDCHVRTLQEKLGSMKFILNNDKCR